MTDENLNNKYLECENFNTKILYTINGCNKIKYKNVTQIKCIHTISQY
jgi:hypothetical protein